MFKQLFYSWHCCKCNKILIFIWMRTYIYKCVFTIYEYDNPREAVKWNPAQNPSKNNLPFHSHISHIKYIQSHTIFSNFLIESQVTYFLSDNTLCCFTLTIAICCCLLTLVWLDVWFVLSFFFCFLVIYPSYWVVRVVYV